MSPNEKADRARQILEDAVFNEALRDIRERIVSTLEAVPVTDHESQHELVLTLQLLQRIPARFKAYIDEMTMVEHRKKQDDFIAQTKQKFSRA